MTHRTHRRSTLALFMSLVCVSSALARSAQKPMKPASAFAFTHVTVIDGTGADPKPDMTVVVRDRVIQAVGKSSEVELPQEMTVIDAKGKFLIPGLWDMHVYCDDPRLANLRPPSGERKELLPMFGASGVIGVRDMGCDELRRLAKWREEVANGGLVAPRLVVCGFVIDGPDSPWPSARECSTAEEAQRTVTKLKSVGADFIGVYSGLSREVYDAVAEESKKLNVPFAGRVPHILTNLEASNAGQASLELMLGMVRDCGDIEAAKAAVSDVDPEMAPSDVIALYNGVLLDTQSPDKERALIECLVKNKTWVTPALIAGQRLAFYDDEKSKMSERLTHLPSFLKEAWKPENNVQLKERTPASITSDRKMQARLIALVGAMHKGGVRLLAGTGSGGTPLCVPGESLHEELALLVQAGLTPAQALRTATSNPAEFLGLAQNLGTVEVGREADLVLLSADPLADIRNTSKVESVVMYGRHMSKERLAQAVEIDEPTPQDAAKQK